MLYIKRNLPKKLFKKLTNIKLFYIGFHNRTYTANLDNIKVQIRVAINKIATHKSEYVFHSRIKNNYFYISPMILIKKWIEGKTYEEIEPDKNIEYKILDELKKIWSVDIKIEKMNWNYYNNEDPKFNEIVAKYSQDFNETTHGDVRPKNIIIDEFMNPHLIDFEWVRKGSKYFDIASFKKFSILSVEEIIKYLEIDKNKLDDYMYLSKIFNDMAYSKIYDKIKDRYIGKLVK
ncbi:hypothetical protein EI74_0510 [Mycoplasma testudineum]|uniref:Protein kinase domain-containing protein n=1 Tax=Mycoplasma testudineum TaxID=244584 RepID=A0A4R6IDY2_9MOLU|nr:hypothetical protein [Mycoplasma testudineum]OYD26735.1 hypothetical protein CG473_02155 [Mycoplasma testudineum]TDO19871.1 hypothetical protein EI74_0510 [Mycoplasma testudineum]